jgi:hypothetical protein
MDPQESLSAFIAPPIQKKYIVWQGLRVLFIAGKSQVCHGPKSQKFLSNQLRMADNNLR